MLPFVPGMVIFAMAVRNEVLESGDATFSATLLPVMQNLRTVAVAAGGATAGVRFSTVNMMVVLAQSKSPSVGAFCLDVALQLQQILGFLSKISEPFIVKDDCSLRYLGDSENGSVH
jgi:hypothetical protein